MSEPVRIVEERDGSWLRIILDSQPGNLLSLLTVAALREALAEYAAVQRKWITFEGAGDHFSYGAQIQEHAPGVMEHVLAETHAMFRQVLALPCPTAALVRGRCLGGAFELALACDAIIATQDATLGLPEIGLAAFPPFAAALLPLRIGASRATEAIIVGASRSAADWKDMGAVIAIAPSRDVLQAAAEWFDAHIAPRSTVALSAAAQASRLTVRAAAEPAIDAAERLYLERVLPSRDALEGVNAFLEKRPPRWIHR